VRFRRGRRDKRRQPGNEIQRLEEHMRRPVAVGRFQRVADVTALGRGDRLDITSTFGLMVGFTILLVLLLVGYHILVAAITGAQDEDQRDRLIGWRAGNIGGLVLGFGVISIVGHIVLGGLVDDAFWQSPAVIANLLLLSVFVATIVELSVTIWFHRRGF
jgi:hypothetical protein